jgi:hypothetical protein
MLLIRIICNVSLLVMISFSSRQKITTDKTIPVLLTSFGRPHSFAKFCPQSLSGIGINPENLQKKGANGPELSFMWLDSHPCAVLLLQHEAQKPKANGKQQPFFCKRPTQIQSAQCSHYKLLISNII